MKYTAEQLEKMSDAAIELEIYSILNPDHDPIVYSLICPSFCSDWSATGPLMVKHAVSTYFVKGEFIFAGTEQMSPGGYIVECFESQNKNPLRAICEVILMMGEE